MKRKATLINMRQPQFCPYLYPFMQQDLTLTQYREVIGRCRLLFTRKMSDYGHSWRILRPTSLTDQLLIKAKRIRSIEISGVQMVNDSIDQDFIGLVNYGIMAIIQLRYPPAEDLLQEKDEVILSRYDKVQREIEELMLAKNHDYGEVWREMRISSMTDLILMKLLRIKQIEELDGKTLVSEGLDANYADIVNYSIFALILGQHTTPHL